MRIDDIFIRKSPVHVRAWVFHIEMFGLKYDGYFDDFPGFMTAVVDAGKFFAVRTGKLRADQAKSTREIAPGIVDATKPH